MPLSLAHAEFRAIKANWSLGRRNSDNLTQFHAADRALILEKQLLSDPSPQEDRTAYERLVDAVSHFVYRTTTILAADYL